MVLPDRFNAASYASASDSFEFTREVQLVCVPALRCVVARMSVMEWKKERCAPRQEEKNWFLVHVVEMLNRFCGFPIAMPTSSQDAFGSVSLSPIKKPAAPKDLEATLAWEAPSFSEPTTACSRKGYKTENAKSRKRPTMDGCPTLWLRHIEVADSRPNNAEEPGIEVTGS